MAQMTQIFTTEDTEGTERLHNDGSDGRCACRVVAVVVVEAVGPARKPLRRCVADGKKRRWVHRGRRRGALRAGQFAVADLRRENRMFQFIQFALNELDEGIV